VNLAISAYLTTADLQVSAPEISRLRNGSKWRSGILESRDYARRSTAGSGLMTSGWPKAWYCLWDEPERVLGRVTLTHSAEHAISKNAVSTALVDSQGN
jgi:hypothetical protein